MPWATVSDRKRRPVDPEPRTWFRHLALPDLCPVAWVSERTLHYALRDELDLNPT